MTCVIALREFRQEVLASEALTYGQAMDILERFSKQVKIEFPSPKTGNKYTLKPKGWVGYIPLGHELGLTLAPKIPLCNLFGMWEVAYRMSFTILRGIQDVENVREYFEQLALILARKIIDRTRKGLYRTYIENRACLPFVRGRIDVTASLRRFGRTSLPCHYQDHTPDILDNRLLAWTLWKIIFSRLCSDTAQSTLHKAFRSINSIVTTEPCTALDCDAVIYNRLNADYQQMHALCRFFLDQTGPTHRTGQSEMLPFLVDMARLFEMFVAEWMKRHLGEKYYLRIQPTKNPTGEPDHKFRPDIVLYDALTGNAVCVIDTKYKASTRPTKADISQVVTYSELFECRHAVLAYPVAIDNPEHIHIGRTTVRTASFDLDGDLEKAGETFLASVIRLVHPSPLLGTPNVTSLGAL